MLRNEGSKVLNLYSLKLNHCVFSIKENKKLCMYSKNTAVSHLSHVGCSRPCPLALHGVMVSIVQAAHAVHLEPRLQRSRAQQHRLAHQVY